MHAPRSERLHGKCSDERGVDPAGDADDDFLEAVLADVVVQPELERKPHLLEVVAHRRQCCCDGVAVLVGHADVNRRDRAEHAAVLRERATPSIGEAARDNRRRVDVDHHQRLFETRPAREHRSLVVDHERMPIEDQLVLPTDGVAEGDERRVVARARAEHVFALAVAQQVERRRRDVHDQLCACERKIGRRRPGLPHVLADRHAEERFAVFEDRQSVTWREVPELVEDAVVREEPLAHERLHLAARADGRRVVEVAVEVRRADDGDDPARLAGDRRQRLLGRTDEAGAEEEVLRRVARDGKLREEHEVGVLCLRVGQPGEDHLPVSCEVAHDGIDLCERDAHRSHCAVSTGAAGSR